VTEDRNEDEDEHKDADHTDLRESEERDTVDGLRP